MRHLSGTGAGSGIAVGVAKLLPPRIQIEERSIPPAEIRAELELLLAWGAVAGAKSYVVQMCEARPCGDSPGEAGRSGRFSQDEYFPNLATVAGTEHLAKGLSSGKVYHFRIMGLDNKGQLLALNLFVDESGSGGSRGSVRERACGSRTISRDAGGAVRGPRRADTARPAAPRSRSHRSRPGSRGTRARRDRPARGAARRASAHRPP